jgi:hypothetical protein
MGEVESLRKELGRLLADLDFLDVHQRLKAGNIFTILKMEYVAAKHSAFLAWLLDPNEDHGLADMFLKRFLSAALMSPPPDHGKPAEEISPIPYEAVYEKMLKWDRMDVLSADLRETNVRTDVYRCSDGRQVDICIWNEAYTFVVYVENVINPRHSWHMRKGPLCNGKEYHSERCLLDLYSRWGSEEGGGYELLPVFLSLGDVEPSETRCFHRIDYTWMPAFLEKLIRGRGVSRGARELIQDFCEWLRFEMPAILDPSFNEKMTRLGKEYGRSLCRMWLHVSQCNGCEADDVSIAYHDVYRRHGATVDYMADLAESIPREGVSAIKSNVEGVLDDGDAVFSEGPSSLCVYSKKWRIDGAEEGSYGGEIFTSLCSRTTGVIFYPESCDGFINRVLNQAEVVAKEMNLDWRRVGRMGRISPVVFYEYDKVRPVEWAADFVRLYNFLDEVFKRLHRS